MCFILHRRSRQLLQGWSQRHGFESDWVRYS